MSKMERESEIKVSKFKRICVFCGSSQGKKSSYQDAAIELGKELVFIFFFLLNLIYLKCVFEILFPIILMGFSFFVWNQEL